MNIEDKFTVNRKKEEPKSLASQWRDHLMQTSSVSKTNTQQPSSLASQWREALLKPAKPVDITPDMNAPYLKPMSANPTRQQFQTAPRITDFDVQQKLKEEQQSQLKRLREIEAKQKTMTSSNPMAYKSLSDEKRSLINKPVTADIVKKRLLSDQSKTLLAQNPQDENAWLQFAANTLDQKSLERFQMDPTFKKATQAAVLGEIEYGKRVAQAKAEIDAKLPKDGPVKFLAQTLSDWVLSTKSTVNTLSGLAGGNGYNARLIETGRGVSQDALLADQTKAQGKLQLGAEQLQQQAINREALTEGDAFKGFMYDFISFVPDMLVTVALSAATGGAGGAAQLSMKSIGKGILNKETRKASLLALGQKMAVSPETLPLGAKIFAGSYQDNRADGMDEGKAFFVAFINAYGQSVLEKGGVNAAVKSGGLNKGVEFMKSALGEGFEEVKQNWWEAAVNKFVGGKDVALYADDMNTEAIINPTRDLYSAGLGAAGGAAAVSFKAPGIASRYVTEKTSPKLTLDPGEQMAKYEASLAEYEEAVKTRDEAKKQYEESKAEFEKKRDSGYRDEYYAQTELLDAAESIVSELITMEKKNLAAEMKATAEDMDTWMVFQDQIDATDETAILDAVLKGYASDEIMDRVMQEAYERKGGLDLEEPVAPEDKEIEPPTAPDFSFKVDTSKMNKMVLKRMEADLDNVGENVANQIVELATEGKTRSDIAKELDVAPRVVRSVMSLKGIPDVKSEAFKRWKAVQRFGKIIEESQVEELDFQRTIRTESLITDQAAQERISRVKALSDAQIVSADELNNNEMMGYRYAQVLGKRLGVDVVYYRGGRGNTRGMYSDRTSNTVYINADETDKKGEVVMDILGHEFLHSMSLNQKDLYKTLRDVVGDTMTPEKVKAQLEKYALDKEYQERLSNDRELLIEEMLAEEAGSLFTDKQFWQNLNEKDATLAQRLVKLMRSFINRVLTGGKKDSGNLGVMTEMQIKQFQVQFEEAVAAVMKQAPVEAEVETGEAMEAASTKLSTKLDDRASGDELLGAQDLIEEIKRVGAEVDENGYVTLYHRTTLEAAEKIRSSGVMRVKEDGLFFSTSKDGQAEGYGDTVVEFKIPAERLQIDDIFDQEAHLRVPIKGRTARVAEWISTDEAKYSTAQYITDADGDAVTFYHGTKTDFEDFDKTKLARTTLNGAGFYFTDSKSVGENYARYYKQGSTPILISAKIKANKVFDYATDLITPEDIESIGLSDEIEIKNPVRLGQLDASYMGYIPYILENLGYDVLKFSDQGGNSYAVYNKEQIEIIEKTKLPAPEKFSIPQPTISISMDEKTVPNDLDGDLHKIYSRIVDKNHAINMASEKAKIMAANSAIVSGSIERIFTHALMDPEGNEVGQSLQEVVKDFAENEDFWMYMAMRHNIDRFREGKPVDPGMDEAASRAYVANAESQNPQYRAQADSVTAWIDKFMRTWAVGTGIIDADTYDEWRAMYPSYFPTFREFSELEESGHGGPGRRYIDLPSVSRKATGSARDITNPVGNIMMMVNKVVRTARYNEVGVALLDTVRQDPQAMVKFAEEIPANVGMFQSKKLDNVVTIWEGGSPQYLQINDKALLDALKGLPRIINNAATMRKLTGVFKGLITQYNPLFALRNIFRDIPTAYVYGSQDNPLFFLGNLAKAGYQIVTDSGGAKLYKNMGGMGSGMFAADEAAQYAKLLQPSSASILKAPLRMIEWINNLTEMAPRISEFNHVMDKTGDVHRALYAAQNVTVNFARGGDLTKAAEPFVPYLNASVQGLDKFFQSFNFKKDPATALKRMAKAGVAVSLPQIASYLICMADDEEKYLSLDQRTRDAYYVFPKGDGTYWKIPKSRELGVLFASLFERALTGNFEGFAGTVKTNFSPVDPFTNNLAAAFVFNLPMNKDFAGRTIVPQNLQGFSNYLQYDDNTSEISKAIGRYTRNPLMPEGLSPKQVDYIVRSYTGVVGQFVLPATTARSGAGTAFERMTVGAFTADPAFSSQAMTDFYDKLDELERAKNDKNRLENIPSKKTTPEEKYYSAMNKLSSNLSKATKHINANLKADDPQIQKIRNAINKHLARAIKTENLADILRINAEMNAELIKLGVR